MTRANQYTNRTPVTRLRQIQKKAVELLEAQDKAERDILLAIHEWHQEGLTNAAIAGAFGYSPSGIAPKAQQGAEILAQGKGGKKAAGG